MESGIPSSLFCHRIFDVLGTNLEGYCTRDVLVPIYSASKIDLGKSVRIGEFHFGISRALWASVRPSLSESCVSACVDIPLGLEIFDRTTG